MTRLPRFPFVLCALLGGVAAPSALAQTFPVKPIRIVMPHPTGGGTDFVLRLIGPKLTERLGQQTIIDSRPGASGAIGMQIATRAAPDGYTLVLGAVGPVAVNPSLYSKLAYDPINELAPITGLVSALNVLVVHPSLPVKTVKQFVALGKARPGQLKFGSSSIGNTDHLAGELFKSMAGIDMVHIPYKGGAQLAIDLVAGQIELVFANYQNVSSQIGAGRLREIASTSLKRWPTRPELPTVAESGVPDFEVTNWYGLFAPAGTPAEVIQLLNAETIRALNLPDVRERLASQGMIPFTHTPAELLAHLRADTVKWARVVKASGARVD
jgi:tripartite-type tricarboxylate transporter receptor subunit TctC